MSQKYPTNSRTENWPFASGNTASRSLRWHRSLWPGPLASSPSHSLLFSPSRFCRPLIVPRGQVIENFVRVPTTYTVTSVEHAGRDTNFDACANETKSPGPKETKVSSETSRPSPLEWSTPSVVGGVLEADTMFPFEHQGREQLLKPVSRAWDGL